MSTKTSNKSSNSTNPTNPTNPTASTKRPYKHIWMVEDREGGEEGDKKSFWTKIGVAFENRDGSWSLDLAAFPVSGRLQLRDPAVGRQEAA